ncbi:MAG: YicC/YloC family endoribonuclease [Pseudomonadota bacterium]
MSGIASMTGFATASRDLEFGTIAVELRAVNHRYLDVQFRMPDDLRLTEGAMREVIASKLSRGKVDCRASFTPLATLASGTELNVKIVEDLAHLEQAVRERFIGINPMNAADILRWPGVLVSRDVPQEALRDATLSLLAEALEEFQQTRLREGEKLKTMLLDRVSNMEKLATEVAPLVPQLVRAYHEKLAQKLGEALGNLDDERLRQEVVLFAAKIDVDEELTRLQAHLSEIRRILSKGGACGKRLDFLMQELNREANTLGSKSASTEVSKVSIELKVLIEQMREQIQNIE